MEIGLRRNWSSTLQEDKGAYGADGEHYFPHESLQLYQRSIQLHQSLGRLYELGQKAGRFLRRIDVLSTSITLNIKRKDEEK